MSARGEFWMRWRVRLGYPVAALYLWLAQPEPAWLAAGAVVAVIGLWIRGAAAGHLRKHEALATSGPYRHTRNPLYLGSAVLAAGFLVAGHSWIAALVVAAYFVLFYPAVMRREEQELRARYGSEFDAYAARAPLFWPRLSASGIASARPFSGALYLRNREWQAALGTVLGFALLCAKWMWWR